MLPLTVPNGMEIRDPVHGNLEFNKGESAVIDHPIFQRLREIKQLGFAEYSFPGGTHNRYLHSIGVCHLAGQIFDAIFREYPFSSVKVKRRFRQVMRLAALLHDVGHGPLSHTTEEVMPKLSDLSISVYNQRRKDLKLSKDYIKKLNDPNRSANHEDYTIKFITDSDLTQVIRKNFSDISPTSVACLIDKTLESQDGFFVDEGVDFREILSQIVSSELDADRMDYLERDSYFCGATYGKIESSWLTQNMTYHQVENRLFLALNRRALYAFDDFLLSRHHIHLMVYFHHKSLIYEELLMRYLKAKDCEFYLPGDINEYVNYTDYYLYEHLGRSKNEWAQRIATRQPYKMLYEHHSTKSSETRCLNLKSKLEAKGFDVIMANSTTRLSKYHTASLEEKSFKIYVVDQYDSKSKPYPIEQSTEIFQKYEEIRRIERLYVAPEVYSVVKKELDVLM